MYRIFLVLVNIFQLQLVLFAIVRSGLASSAIPMVRARMTSVNHRDFIVNVKTSSDRNATCYPMVFDTGSGKIWIESDRLTKLKGSGRRGYPLNGHEHRIHEVITYGAGHSLSLDYKIYGKLYVGNHLGEFEIYVTDTYSPDFAISFGPVGIIGATLVSPVAQKLGQFYLIPYSKRNRMYIGPFRHPNKCRNPMTFTPIISGENWHWNVNGSMNIGGNSLSSVFTLDTGMPNLELEDSFLL